MLIVIICRDYFQENLMPQGFPAIVSNVFNRVGPTPADAFYSSVHVIGHGLGAHVGSYVCQSLKDATASAGPVVGRLTGKTIQDGVTCNI
jgi:hypothetical protein